MIIWGPAILAKIRFSSRDPGLDNFLRNCQIPEKDFPDGDGRFGSEDTEKDKNVPCVDEETFFLPLYLARPQCGQ